jgi:hypothetical protein
MESIVGDAIVTDYRDCLARKGTLNIQLSSDRQIRVEQPSAISTNSSARPPLSR